MIVQREPFTRICGGTLCNIWLEEPKPSDFAERLLTELLALSAPVGIGHFEAFARRKEDADNMINTALHEALHDRDGQRHRGGEYNFDYVAGHRIKAWYLPEGLPVYPDDPDGPPPYPGLPYIASLEFEEMYGKGSLEGAVRLALGQPSAI